MANKTKKAQVVVAALDEEKRSFSFLLLQTNQRRGEFWQNVTGKVEKEESYEDGALRETVEESGLPIEIVVDLLDLELSHEFFDSRDRDVHEKAFLIVAERKWPIVLDPHEHQAFKWVPMNEIKSDVVKYQGNFEALEKSIHILRHWGL